MSESQPQNKNIPYISVLVVLFPIFVALNILDHVEKGVLTPFVGLKQSPLLKKKNGHGPERHS